MSGSWAEREYTTALLVLTAATGAVDGVSYLALDRVFTGNMTGNVLFIGFGLVGVADIPVLNNLVALLTFLLGAALASRLTRSGATGAAGAVRLPRSSMWVLVATTAGTFVLAGVWLGVGRLGTPTMVVVTGVLALLLGAQASAVKHIGIRDLSTVVVTMTMVNLAGDSRLGGGAGPAWGRRVGAIVTMGLGALASAAVVRFLGGAWALVLAGVLMAAALGLLHRARRADQEYGGAASAAGTAPTT